MINWKEYCSENVEKLGEPEGEDVYHRLLEADNSIIPYCIETYRTSTNPIIRSKIIEIIWQHRLPETVAFLSEALGDVSANVWKSALDGLVTMGGDSAIEILKSARKRSVSDDLSEWIDEAIQQIEDRRRSAI
jgi:hypothetical protein